MKKIRVKGLLAKLLVLICVICSLNVNQLTVNAAENTLLNTYGAKYGYSGTCINLYQLRDANTLATLKKNYNSITLENEMKPDALLGSSASLISVSVAKNQGYYIPSGYKESYVPKINFNTVDEVMKICYNNGLKMRAHTLVWHSQTPTWFFRSNYSSNNGYVNSSTMDARMEMYIKTVMNHVYSSQYGSTVYCWDVVNEYLHATNSGWESVYGKGGTSPAFVKKAFQYAYETLEYYKLTDSVKLFYNDYNTYMEVNDVIKLVNYINSDKKICAGVGMQSHLGTTFPSVDYYTSALKSFLNAGFEVQITEIDITNKGDSDLATYSYNLFKNINSLKKNGGKITCVTWWGLSDQTTWINNAKPLLFSTPTTKKSAYDKVIQAYTETFGQPSSGNQGQGGSSQGGSSQNGNSQGSTQPSSSNTNTNGNGSIANGWYYLKNTNSQKYLTVEGNKATAGTNVCISTGTGVDGQKWYVTNTSDGYITLASKLGSFMLDVANASSEDGANIGIYHGYSGDAQKFKVKKTSTNNVYTLATKCSNEVRYIDVYNHGKTDGTNVCQWLYYGNPNQQWIFEKVNEQSGSTPSSQPTQPIEQPQPTQPSAMESGLKLDYTINSWGSGYTVSFKVANNTGKTVNTWNLKLKKSDIKISSAWNVNVTTSGDYYLITPVSWNSTIGNGSFVEFGIQGDGSIGNTIGYTF